MGATIDRPPPPADLDEGEGGGEETYVVRFLTNEEREYYAHLWLGVASPEDGEMLKERVVPFRSHPIYSGTSRMCMGVFLNGTCEGLATTAVGPDASNLKTVLFSERRIKVFAIATRPWSKTSAGSMLVRGIKQLADEQGWNMDFEPVRDIKGGRYWVQSRSL